MKKFLVSTSIALAASVSSASAAPVTNKTITVQWAGVGNATRADGTNHNFTTNIALTIYVSSAGRLFARAQTGSRNSGLGSSSGEMSPDGQSVNDGVSRSLKFQGNTLVGNAAWQSGAVQFMATLDPSFTSCTLRVVYGRSGSKSIEKRGPDGSRYVVNNIQAMQPTCQISEGNPFR